MDTEQPCPLSSLPMAIRSVIKRVGLSQYQSRKSSTTDQTDLGTPSRLPSTHETRSVEGVPPSTGRSQKATPPQIDHVASVTMERLEARRGDQDAVDRADEDGQHDDAEELEDQQAPTGVEMRGEQRGGHADRAADREVDAAA